jgi:hypothetical protein
MPKESTMSYYTDKVRFVMLIEDKIKEMNVGDVLSKDWLYYKGLSMYGYSNKTVDSMMKALTTSQRVTLTSEGDLMKIE